VLTYISLLLSSQGTNLFLTVICGAVINRSLGPAGRGDYAELMVWVSFFVSLFELSTVTTVYHFSDQKQYSFSKKELFGSVLALWGLAAVLATAGILGGAAFFPNYFSKNFQINLLSFLFLTLATIGIRFQDSLLKINKSFLFLSVFAVLSGAARLLGIGLLAIFGTLTVARLLSLHCFVQLLGTGACIFYFRRKSRDAYPVRIRMDLVMKMLRSGLKIHAATVATLLYVQVDQLMLYNMAGRLETGYYAVAVSVGMQTMILPNSIQQVFYPLITEYDVRQAAGITIRLVKYSIFAYALFLGAVYVLAYPLINLYAGQEYEQSVPLLRSLLLGIFFFSIPNLLSPYWVRGGYFTLASVSAILLLVLNFTLNYSWIPQYGAVGAVWATNVTYFAGMLSALCMFYLLSGQNPLRIFWFDRTDFVFLRRRLALGVPTDVEEFREEMKNL
jgi:enterobacterial common antigen flippase